jgi:uncharacterized protein (TIGR03437 family)
MRRLPILLALFALSSSLDAADVVVLPKSLHLAAALNPATSQFGDEFYNFPAIFGGRAHPGATYQSGRLEFWFTPPVNGITHFKVTYDGVGTPDGIVFPGGQTYDLLDNRVFNNPLFESGGDLDLATGNISNFSMHSIFQNSTIARVTKNIRIPFGFVSDYPPTSLPISYPFTDKPEVSTSVRFHLDTYGNITGFEFAAFSVAPVTLFPRLGIFPPFSFGDSSQFYFANPTGCLPNAPPQNCINDQNNPDGVKLASNAFFHPHFNLYTDELKEMPATTPIPPCQPKAIASGNGLVAVSGKLYQVGGFDGTSATGLVQIYDPGANQWGPGASMTTPVMAAQSAAMGSKIFVAGGFSPSSGAYTNLLQVFVPSTNSWGLAHPAPLAVGGGVAAAVNNKLYVIGGWTADRTGTPALTGQVQIYDPVADSWSSGAAAPLATAGSASAVVGSRIYIINGRIAGDTVTNRIFIYDTSADAWQELSKPSPVGVYEASAGYLNNRIYLVGGRQTVDGAVQQLLQTYELALGEWRKGLEPLLPTAAGTAVVLDGKLYIAGGRIMTGADAPPGMVTDQVQSYDPGLGWNICNSHPLFTSAMVMNEAAGSVAPAILSPGTRTVISGFNFSDSVVDAPPFRLDTGLTTDLPTSLNGISVRVDGNPAPIIRVGPRQVEFQVPQNVRMPDLIAPANPPRFALEVIKEGSLGQQPAVQIPLEFVSPGIYVSNYNEFRYTRYLDGAMAIARRPDGTMVYSNNPTHVGEVITLRMTGLGTVSPQLQNGERAGTTPPQPDSPLTATIGGLSADIVSAALKTGDVGIYEVQVKVPSNCPTGNNVPVLLTVAGIQSNRAVIAVR